MEDPSSQTYSKQLVGLKNRGQQIFLNQADTASFGEQSKKDLVKGTLFNVQFEGHKSLLAYAQSLPSAQEITIVDQAVGGEAKEYKTEF